MEYELIERLGEKILHHIPSDSWIPIDPANSDYQRFLIWNAEQETPIAIEGE